MLKGISPLISPELLHTIASMGHGDEIVIADGNFPTASMAKRSLRLDGHSVPPVLEAILKLFPLDEYSAQPIALMEVVPGDPTVPVIWDEFKRIITAEDDLFIKNVKEIESSIEMVERFAFYERAKEAFAVVATGEKALYANIILRKGVI